MLLGYILLEIIIMVLGISNLNTEWILYLPTILSILFFSLNKGNNKILLGLTITLPVTYFILKDITLGLSFMIFIQVIYTFYLKKTINPKLIIIEIINIIIVSILKEKTLVLELFLYHMVLISNLLEFHKGEKIKVVFHSFIWQLITSILMTLLLVMTIEGNMKNLIIILGWITFIVSQITLVIGTLEMVDSFLFRLFSPVFTSLLRLYYHPTIINKEAIPKEGKAVIAGNHKHALDPILVNSCTNRVVHTLAKKELHDGKFGWFLKLLERYQ